MPDLVVGQLFPSLAEFKRALQEYAVERRFTPAILDSDTHRVRAGCRSGPDCPFRLRANWSARKNQAKVTTVQDEHTCFDQQGQSASTQVARTGACRLKFLADAVPKLMTVTEDTPTKLIQEAIERKYGQKIAPRQAQKVKKFLCPRPKGPCQTCGKPYHRSKRGCPETWRNSRQSEHSSPMSSTADFDNHADDAMGDPFELNTPESTHAPYPSFSASTYPMPSQQSSQSNNIPSMNGIWLNGLPPPVNTRNPFQRSQPTALPNPTTTQQAQQQRPNPAPLPSTNTPTTTQSFSHFSTPALSSTNNTINPVNSSKSSQIFSAFNPPSSVTTSLSPPTPSFPAQAPPLRPIAQTQKTTTIPSPLLNPLSTNPTNHLHLTNGTVTSGQTYQPQASGPVPRMSSSKQLPLPPPPPQRQHLTQHSQQQRPSPTKSQQNLPSRSQSHQNSQQSQHRSTSHQQTNQPLSQNPQVQQQQAISQDQRPISSQQVQSQNQQQHSQQPPQSTTLPPPIAPQPQLTTTTTTTAIDKSSPLKRHPSHTSHQPHQHQHLNPQPQQTPPQREQQQNPPPPPPTSSSVPIPNPSSNPPPTTMSSNPTQSQEVARLIEKAAIAQNEAARLSAEAARFYADAAKVLSGGLVSFGSS